jgi:hypothetical protein
MTRQLGAFDSTSLGAQGILNLWGASGQDPPHAVVELGRLSAADTTAKTLTVTLDSAVHASATINKIFTLAAYDVTASGRATLTYTDGTTSRSFVLYLDSPDNGYVVELNSPQGSAGLLEAQVAGPFSGTLPGVFVYGTQFAQDPGPVTLLPLVTIASDVISSGSGTATGNVGLDPATSRGIGFFTSAGNAQTVIVSYEVSPGQVRVLRFGLRLTAAALEFLGT